jgi:hypothetical protein
LPPGKYILEGNTPGGGGQDFCWLVLNVQASIKKRRVEWLHRDGVIPGDRIKRNFYGCDLIVPDQVGAAT